MKGNAGSEYGRIRRVAVDLHKEMALFDQLPRQIRDLLNEAPLQYDLKVIPSFLDRHGEAATVLCMKAAFEEGREIMRAEMAEVCRG